MSLIFRWLGVAGVELRAGNQVLAIDPFFTRPSLRQMLRPVETDRNLAVQRLPHCDVVLVTHSHYDHVMDIPAVIDHTGGQCFGSANTCQVLRLSGVPEAKIHQVQIGDHLALGAFQVEVIQGRHSWIPFSRVFNGSLKPGLHLPLRAWDYRMDICLGYRIIAMGMHVLVCAAEPQPAQLLFAVAQEPREYYLKLFRSIHPDVFVPIHWDDFTRPLDMPLRHLHPPGRLSVWQITYLARQVMPRTRIIIPEIFRGYTLEPQ